MVSESLGVNGSGREDKKRGAERKGGMTTNAYGVCSSADKTVLNLTIVMVVQFCEDTKHHCIVHFMWMNYMTCEVYLNLFKT